jgi:hypothetical protein
MVAALHGSAYGREEVLSSLSARFYAKQIFMKAISAKPKSAGRPATGITPMIGFRADPVIRAEIVRWAKNQTDTPSLSESIRRLVEIGLSAAPLLRGGVLSSGPTARDLAAAQIDRMGDVDASADDQATRKRRLLKGPLEFRDSRVDVEERPRPARRRPAPK